MSSEKPSIRVVAAVVERGGLYLITQRRPTALLPLLWEFPGGRVEVESGESDEDALRREVKYRLGLEVAPRQLMSFVSHPYDHYVVELYLYDCQVVAGEPQALNVHDYRWVKSEQFEQFDFTPADESSMTQLLGLKLD